MVPQPPPNPPTLVQTHPTHTAPIPHPQTATSTPVQHLELNAFWHLLRGRLAALKHKQAGGRPVRRWPCRHLHTGQGQCSFRVDMVGGLWLLHLPPAGGACWAERVAAAGRAARPKPTPSGSSPSGSLPGRDRPPGGCDVLSLVCACTAHIPLYTCVQVTTKLSMRLTLRSLAVVELALRRGLGAPHGRHGNQGLQRTEAKLRPGHGPDGGAVALLQVGNRRQQGALAVSASVCACGGVGCMAQIEVG